MKIGFEILDLSSPACALHHLCSPEIVQVNNTFYISIFVNDNERSDLGFLHHGKCRRRKFDGRDGFGIASHAIASGEIEDILAALFQQTAKITVADDTKQAV